MADHRTMTGVSSVSLRIADALKENGIDEVLDVTVFNLPPGAKLSAGTDNGDGSWSLTAADLEGLTITPPPDWSAEINLSVSATTVEAGMGGAPMTTAFGYTVPPLGGSLAPRPEEAVSAGDPAAAAPAADPGESPEGRAVGLDIDMDLGETEDLDSLIVTISGVPPGAALSAGADEGDGIWILKPEDLNGLSILLPADFKEEAALGIAAVAADGSVSAGSLVVGPDLAPVSGPEPEPRPEPEPIPEPEPAEAAEAAVPPEAAAASTKTAAGIYRPIAYWKLDETTPGVVVDEMGNHPGQSLGDTDTDGAGPFDAVAAFDGIDDYIEVPPTGDMELRQGSFTAWFDAFASGGGTLAVKGSPDDDAGACFSLTLRNGKLRLLMRKHDQTAVAEGGSFNTNEWNQVTVTWGSGGTTVYLNGHPVATGDDTGGLAGNDGPWIFGATGSVGDGGVLTAPGDFFHGELDDIALYGHPFNAAEARDLCQIGVEGMMAGDRPADMDSPLDFGAIPVETEGPESLATLDTPVPEDNGPIPEDEGPAPAPDPEPETPPADIPADDSGDDGEVFVFGAGEGGDYFQGGDGWSDTVRPDSAPDSANDAGEESGAGDSEPITVAEGDELTLEGGEKMEW